ncbi:hypothetical protein F5X96DRAFT_24150 [Biscogniauxia mediterranea]|nr:hypothetical protein F5X96DRAFT_24150 [Biscogniauxia mediterranea]
MKTYAEANPTLCQTRISSFWGQPHAISVSTIPIYRLGELRGSQKRVWHYHLPVFEPFSCIMRGFFSSSVSLFSLSFFIVAVVVSCCSSLLLLRVRAGQVPRFGRAYTLSSFYLVSISVSWCLSSLLGCITILCCWCSISMSSSPRKRKYYLINLVVVANRAISM